MSISPLSKKLAVFAKEDLLRHSSMNARKWSDRSKGVLKSLFDSLVHSDHLWKTGSGVAIKELEKTGVSEYSVSTYIPDPIRATILRKMDRNITFQLKIGKRTVLIHIISTELSNSVILGMIHRMYLWLSIVFRYASPHCAKILDVFLYLTEDAKRVPVSPMEMIDRKHVNTAFTTSCKPEIEIHIFREEEWFKVFIHECFHCFGLDFSGMSEASHLGDRVIKDYFGLNSEIDLRIYETYTETWAEIVHTMLQSFLHSRSRVWENIFRHFAKSLMIEQSFSIFQCCKVLSHNGLSYRNICARSMGRYNEKSHAFSYYILKSALLYHTGDFIDWCIVHNGDRPLAFRQTEQNIRDFGGLLIGVCCQTGYLSSVSEIGGRFLYYKRSGKHRDIIDTLRMTVYG
jgi:hypothetical protein